MSEKDKILTPNALSFIGLCKEYCIAVANASNSEQSDFVDTMLRLLPRLYITANDLALSISGMSEDIFIDDYLDETTYDDAREAIAQLLSEYDAYLDVFEEDMKFSETPITASISEGLCDLLQEFYNFLETVRDSTDDIMKAAIAAVCEDFRNQWSLTLCNVFRALNKVKHSFL